MAPSRLHQRQRLPEAAPKRGQPRLISPLGRAGRPGVVLVLDGSGDLALELSGTLGGGGEY
eukprot:scaffold116868_cov63-Phaeocystis_antarctica.AAC.3